MVEVEVEVEVEVVETKDKEEKKLSSAVNTNTVGNNDGEEKIKVVVMIEEEEEEAAGTKEVVDDQDEKKKKTNTTMSSSTNVKSAAGDHPTTVDVVVDVVVDGEKLKARVKRLIMWSLVYFLLYWIRLVIKRDYYEVGLVFYSSIMFTFFFLLNLIVLATDVVDQINSLVLFMTKNHNIPPPTCCAFKSSTTTSTTTTIDRMTKGIRDSCVNILIISLVHNCTHMALIVPLGISLRMNNQSPKPDDFIFQMLYGGCIFFVILAHADWEDKFHEEQSTTSFIRRAAEQKQASPSIDHTDNTTSDQ